MNLPEEKTWRSRVVSVVNDRLTLATILLGIGVVVLAVIIFGLRSGSSGTVANTASSSSSTSRVAVASPSASPAAVLITPSPVPGSPSSQMIFGGTNSGSAGSTSGGGSSSSSTDLKTENAYNYYTTLANGTLVAAYSPSSSSTPTPTNNPGVLGATCGTGATWKATPTNSDWNTASNWVDARVPCSTDDITIGSTSINPNLSLSGGTATINSLSMTAGTLTLSGGGTANQLNVTTFVNMSGGSVITHAANAGTQTSSVIITTGTYFTIGASASVNVNGDGFSTLAGSGYPGGGNSGGSHGGIGGTGSYTANQFGSVYDSITSPAMLGGGSGAINGPTAGGGAVKLVVGGLFTHTGSIAANGSGGSNAGGAGGSIWISANTWSGTGAIYANGGNGNVNTYYGGGGGGGRIALYATSGATTFTASTLTASGGSYSGSNSTSGGGGTIYVKDSNYPTNGALTIDTGGDSSSNNSSQTLSTTGNPETYDSFTLKNYNYYTVPTNRILTATTASFPVANSGTLRVVGTGAFNGSAAMFTSAGGLAVDVSAASATITGLNGATTINVPSLLLGSANNISFSQAAVSFSGGLSNSGTITTSGSTVLTLASGNITNNATGVISTAGLTLSTGTQIYNYGSFGSAPGPALILNGTSQYISYTNSAVNLASLVDNSSTTMSHGVNAASQLYSINFNIAGNATIAAAASINVFGDGFSSGGNGFTGATNSGGGHGGIGGTGTYVANSYGGSYDSITSPTSIGGSSGTSYGVSAGGGAVKLIVGGLFTHTGGIYADGRNGVGGSAIGGGAGGSIWISANTWSGTGAITANGGYGSANAPSYGGGGAGGRVALYATSGATTGTPTATGGATGGGSASGAGGGTIYIKDSNNPTNGALIIDAGGGTSANITNETQSTTGNPETYDSFTLRDYNYYTVPTGKTLTATTASFSGIASSGTLKINGTFNGSSGMFASGSAGLTVDVSTAGAVINGLSGATTINVPNMTLGSSNTISFSQPAVSFTGYLANYGTITTSGSTVLTVASGNISNYATGVVSTAGLTLSTGTQIYNYGSFGSAPGPALVLNGTSSYTSYTNSVVNLASLVANGTSRLSHNPNGTTQAYVLSLNVAGNVTIASTATIDVGNEGFTGGGSGYGGSGNSGGAHGGVGGAGTSTPQYSSVYDSITQPTALGGSAGAYGPYGHNNYPGGGTIKLIVGGTLTHTGGIYAMGGSFTATGGSAGGSIWIQANAWSGTGAISANGGNGSSDGYSPYGGGGGGGRIALYATTGAITGTPSATGGAGAANGATAGGGGTIYTKDSNNPTNGALTIDTGGDATANIANETQSTTGSPETYDSFTLRNFNYYTVPTGKTLTATTAVFSGVTTSGTLRVVGTGVFNGSASMFSNAPGLTVDASAAGATITGLNGATTISLASLSLSSANNIAFSQPAVSFSGGLSNSGTITTSGSTVLTVASGNISNYATGVVSTAGLTLSTGTQIYNYGSFGSAPGPALILNGTSQYSSYTTNAVNVASVTTTGASSLTHGANNGASALYTLNLNVAGNFTICSNCNISASNLGFTVANGPGHPGTLGTGGSHGGLGYGTSPAAVYDSLTQPTQLGSPGGGNNGYAAGGAVKLIVGGTFTNNGGVYADGSGSAANSGSGGSASGGSVWISANAWAGTAAITANGGGNGLPNYSYGAGGGGRIALYTATGTVTGTQSAAGGSQGAQYGGFAGTVYIANSGSVKNSPDTAGNVGKYTSTALNSSGVPTIAYYDVTNLHLKLAVCANSSCSSMASDTTIDSSANVGTYASVALNSSGIASVVYYDAAAGHLKYALCNDVNCSAPTINTIDSAASVGTYASIALYSGVPRIAYYDATAAHLKYILCNDATCATPTVKITVDSGTSVGTYASIAVDAAGVPSIAYYDATNQHPKYLRCTDANCGTAPSYTIDSTSGVGTYTSLALNSSTGIPSIAYYDINNQHPKFARCAAVSCSAAPTSYTLDSSTNVGTYTSIALGSDGFARVAYYDAANGFLKFAKCTNVACSTSTAVITADSNGGVISAGTGVGQYTSVAVASADNTARVAYYDVTNGDLKVWLEAPTAISSFYFSVAPTTGAAGAASTVFTVGAKDISGNISSAQSNTNVYLYSTSGTGTFSTTSGGSYTTALTVTMVSGSGSVSFFYKDTVVSGSPYTVRASDQSNYAGSDTGVTDATGNYSVTAGAAVKAVFSTPTLTVAANAPSSVVTLTSKDQFNNTTNVVSSATFTLSDASGGQFSLTSSPFTPVGSVTIGAGASAVSFYYQSSSPGSYTITAHNASYSPDPTIAATVNQAAITQYYYASSPSGNGTAGQPSTVFTVGAKDVSGNIITVTANTSVYLYSSSGTGTFSTASGGSYTSTLTVTIAASGTTTSFYYKDNTAGTFTVRASDQNNYAGSDTGITDATVSYGLNASTATAYVLNVANITVTANQPSSAITITTKDAFGNTAPVASNTTFALSGTDFSELFSLTSSPFNSVTNVTVNSGQSSASFYYKSTTPGVYTILTHASGFSPDQTVGVTVNQATVTSFGFVSPPSSITVGTATQYTVAAKDSGGNPVILNAPMTVFLYEGNSANTASAGTNLFSTSGVLGPFTAHSVVIPANSSSASFYYVETTAGNYIVHGSDQSSYPTTDTGLTDATAAVTQNPGPITNYDLTPDTFTATANQAHAMAITTFDNFGNPSPVGSSTTFTLTDGSAGQFSLSNSPFTPVGSVTVNSGSSSVNFFYKTSLPSVFTITAHNASYADQTSTVTVNQATVTHYTYISAPSSGPSGAASAGFTVEALDASGNAVVMGSFSDVFLYTSGNGQFSSVSSGGWGATSVNIPTYSSTVTFYYKGGALGVDNIVASPSSGGLVGNGNDGVNAWTQYTVTVGAATAASLSPSSTTATAGSATSVITLTTQDGFGNTSNVGSNTTFTLSDGGHGGVFSNSGPGGPFTATTVTVNSGASTAGFYYRNNIAGNYTVTVHNASFTDGTMNVTVNASSAVASFYYATAPSTGAAGTASTVFTIGAKDVFGNITSPASNTGVHLYSSGSGGTFSTTSGGTYTSALTITILSGNPTANFFYKNNSLLGSPYTITASDNAIAPDGATGIADAATSYTVTTGAASASVLTPSSQSVTAGIVSSVMTLTTKDSGGNTTNVATNTTFTLSDGGNGGQFSLTSSPFTPVSTVTVNSGSSSATFYYKNTSTGSYTLSAHATGFSPDATASVTVNSGTIASYYFLSAPSSANISVASGAFVVGAHDVFGNVVTVGSNTTVYLYSSAATGTFSNSGSGGPYTATSVVITNGNTTASFYYKDPIANPVTITASDQTPTHTPDTGIVDANTAFTVFNPDVVVGPNMPIPHRSATVSDSRPGDPNVSYSWDSTTATTIKAIRVQLCTDGLKNTACTIPTGADLSTSTLASTGGELGASGWSITTVVSAHEILITNSTGAATTIGGTSNFSLANFTNPTSVGTFFFRISTYTTVAALPGDSISFGTVGASSARSLTPTADVAESLVFRVANAVASDCSSQTDIADPNDAASDLVTLSPNPMTMSTTSIGTAQMCATSNAQHGYTITYFDAALGGATKGFWNGAHEFAVANQFTSTQGTEQFGFNLRANTTPAVGFDPDGNGLVADLTNADYGTVDRFSYNDTGASTILAQKSAPNAATARYTMSYLANISSTTQGGTYKAHQVFVITATF